MSADLRERTQGFALRIIHLYNALPHTEVARVLGNQVLRSGTSVGANYAEAERARSRLEFKAKLGVALQELNETLYWLELLVAAGIVSLKKVELLIDETNQLIAIFVASIKKS
jgi:four helix bundle protein